MLVYNFYVALNYKYDFSGDASDYIHLGTSLAKTGNYGHLNFEKSSLRKEFESGKISNKLLVSELKISPPCK